MTKGTGKARKLMRQLPPAKTTQVVLFGVYENTTYELYHEIHGKAARDGIDIRAEIESITNNPALETLFDTYQPQVIFHAAAHEHVPLMENNPRDEQVIIRHNFGSCLLNTIKAQLESGIKLVLNKPKCAFGRRGRDFVLFVASTMVAA